MDTSLLSQFPSFFDRGLKRARFSVLRLTKSPAILIEGGFLSNEEDLRHISSSSWREKYASAIAQGIVNYQNSKNPNNSTNKLRREDSKFLDSDMESTPPHFNEGESEVQLNY
jgi:hypothetical protein